MARFRIIILDRPDPTNVRIYRYVLWADVPTAQQPFYANATATSAWPGAAAGDITAIRSGAVREKLDTLQVPAGTTMAQVQVFLQNLWTAYQAEVTSSTQAQRYGSTWDGTTWVVTNLT